MHFALPPRKSSHPPPYARASRPLPLRRKQLQLGGLIIGALIVLIYLIASRLRPSKAYVPYGTPEVVIVTLLDEPTMSQAYRNKVVENRQYYADKHGMSDQSFGQHGSELMSLILGYATFFPNVSDYELGNSPRSWAVVPSMRHAMTLFPHSTFFVGLSAHGLIMNPSLDLKTHVMDRKRLESLMLRDKPVVPPDSVIRTFSHLRGDKIDLVITQDGEGLCQGSIIMRRGEWAKFFLDTWFDPLYRSYNFQKAEGHALVSVESLENSRKISPLTTHYRSMLCNGTRQY